MRNRIINIFFLIITFLSAPKISGKEYYFNHYNITNGLSQNTVNKILQDKTGFMWFATKDGLNRFDGKNFRIIDKYPDEGNFSFITTIFEDSKGKIWVGTHQGPYMYSPKYEKLIWFCENNQRDKILNCAINAFEELPDGRILIAAENEGVYVFNPEIKTPDSLIKITSDYPHSVMAICYSNKGKIYFGTFGDGLYVADKNFKNIKKLYDKSKTISFDNCTVNTLTKDGDRIFIGTDNMGLFLLDENTEDLTPIFTHDDNGRIPFIRDINIRQGSDLFIASESGLYIYDIIGKKIKKHLVHDYFDRFSLSDDAIYSVYFDRDEGLWVGSYFGGIDYMGANQPEFIKYVRKTGSKNLKSERIRELCMDSQGLVYIGSEDHGLSVFNPVTQSILQMEEIKEKNIQCLCVDGDDLWIGTFSEGLIKLNIPSGKIKRFDSNTSSGLLNDYVFSVSKCMNGDLYIGTFSGLQKYDRQNDTFHNIKPLNDLFIYNIKEDSKGNIWVATYSNGLFIKQNDSDEWINYAVNNLENNIPSNKVYSIQEDSHGNVWVMTQNGPCIYNDGFFDHKFMGVDRIPGVIYRMEEDNLGNYWLSSNHGIYCIDPYNNNIRNYTVKDGLTTNQFNYNSSLKTPDGKIYFGSIDGFISFDPEKMKIPNESQLIPIATQFFLHSTLILPQQEDSPLTESITLTKKINLKPRQNSFGLNLSTLKYDNLGLQIMKYRLKGADQTWKYTDSGETRINYSNLDPGNYTFQALVVNPEGKELGSMYQLDIAIAQPIYKSWWAITIYIILGGAIISFLLLYHRRYSRLSNQRYIENYKHNKEKELYDSKINFFTNVAHEIRTPLTLIKAPLDTVSKRSDIVDDPEIKENLEVVNLNVDRLLQLTNQLLDFRKMESGNYSIFRKECDIKNLVENLLVRFLPTIEASNKRLELNLPKERVLAAVDSEAITKIISNLINNAIKYGDTYIGITLDSTEEGFIFIIENDGKIISKEEKEKIFSLFTRLDNQAPGTGIGLSFSRSLAIMHGGSLDIKDDSSKNVFVLSIPYGVPDINDNKTDDESDLEKIVKSSGYNENVLLVEDNQELLSFIQKKLIANNYKVFTAISGDDALRILEEQHIDIVVSDVMMPGIDGIQLLKKIKENLYSSHIPVILLTAKTNIEDKLAGLEAGADYYIEKPFSMEYLLVSMGSLLRNRDRLRHKLEINKLEKVHDKGLTKADEDFIKKLNDIITDNFSNPEFSVDEIIAEMGMGSTTFYRKVKGLLNLNPNQYIKIQRLKKAAQLFREGYTSVSEVCYLVGFSSPGYFARCFHQQFGVQPKDYIKGKV